MAQYKFLDCYTFEELSIRSRPFLIAMAYLLLFGTMTILMEIFHMNYRDMDTRDVMDAYSDIRLELQYYHDLHFRSGSISRRSVPVIASTNEITATSSLWMITDSKGDMNDPRLVDLFGPIPIFNTKGEWEYYGSTLDLTRFEDTIRDGAGFAQDISFTLFGNSYSTPLVDTTFDFDEDTVQVRYLADVEFRMLYHNAAWLVVDMIPSYSAPSEMAISDVNEAFRGSREWLVIPLRITDACQPRPYFPKLTDGWRAYTGFIMAVLGWFGSVLYLAYWRPLMKRHVYENHGLPPPFFGGFQRFRGW
eukprot:Rmarinus@m.18031